MDTSLESLLDTLGQSCGAVAEAVNPPQRLGASGFLVARSGQLLIFVKYAPPSRLAGFAAESAALEEIARLSPLRVPGVIGLGETDDHSFLAIEWLELRASGDATALGEGLAAMHSIHANEHGWHSDNLIGETRQPNTRMKRWSEFWLRHRLGFQLELASTGGWLKLVEYAAPLLGQGDALFRDHEPPASLLHGDLWSGNHAYLPGGEPVVFDPASYHGDRETDLAMTELFGGFDPRFFDAYRACAPLADDYARRRPMYQLYHALNHVNLFGRSYLGLAMELTAKARSSLGLAG